MFLNILLPGGKKFSSWQAQKMAALKHESTIVIVTRLFMYLPNKQSEYRKVMTSFLDNFTFSH